MLLAMYCVIIVDSPSGWDTENKISILYESMTNVKPDDAFGSVIIKPTIRKVVLNFLYWLINVMTAKSTMYSAIKVLI